MRALVEQFKQQHATAVLQSTDQKMPPGLLDMRQAFRGQLALARVLVRDDRLQHLGRLRLIQNDAWMAERTALNQRGRSTPQDTGR
jgi:hypothetical protein